MGDKAASQPGGVFVRRLLPEDAPQLIACFERCYGDTYVAAAFYDPTRLAALVAAERLLSVVAVHPADGIVGHMGLTIRERPSLTVDAGNTVVDPRCRGQNLAAQLAAELVALCRERGFVGFHHYPTTAHPVMQKLAVSGGGVESGVMLGYIPAGTDYRELTDGTSGRLAVVVVYQPLAAAPPRRVHAPERYAATFAQAWREARLEREIVAPSKSLAVAESQVSASFDARRGLLLVSVNQVGHDVGARVEALAGAQGADVEHVDLGLDDAGIEVAVGRLRDLGFRFAALLPEYAMGDVLRMQRLRDPSPELLQQRLVTEGGQRLLAVITADSLA